LRDRLRRGQPGRSAHGYRQREVSQRAGLDVEGGTSARRGRGQISPELDGVTADTGRHAPPRPAERVPGEARPSLARGPRPGGRGTAPAATHARLLAPHRLASDHPLTSVRVP